MLERRGDKITSCYQSSTSYARDTSTDALELSERREMMLKQRVTSKANQYKTGLHFKFMKLIGTE